MKREFSVQTSEKSSSIQIHEYPYNVSRVFPCGRTHMTKLIVAFRNFVNILKKENEK
jgi:hypothetical protein